MGETTWSHLDMSNSAMTAGLQAVKDGVIPVVNATVAIIKFIQTIMDLIVKFYVDLSDPLVAVVIAALDAVRAILDELMVDAGIYALTVAPVALPTYSSNSSWYEEFIKKNNDILEKTTKTVEEQLADAGESTADATKQSADYPLKSAAATADAIHKLLTNTTGGGGNAGFYRTVAESLDDYGDSNRPNFGMDSYVAGLVILLGATDYYQLIEMIMKLKNLIVTGGQSGMDDPSIPRPKGLTAKLVGATADNPSQRTPSSVYAVKLEWKSEDVNWQRALYGGVSGDIKEVVVYRQTTPVKKGTPVSQMNEVTRFPYYGVNSFYYDTDSGATPNTTLYYHVGYTFDVVKDGVVQKEFNDPQALAGTVVQFGSKISTGTGHGVPPDWAAMNFLDLFPILKNVLDQIKLWLDAVEAGLQTSKDKIKKFLDFLNKQVDFYANWVTDISNQVAAIIEILAWPNIYVGTFQFEGQGGNDYFLEALAKKLTDETDGARPPFDTGAEVVMGLVIMGGAEHPNALKKLKSLFKLFAAAPGGAAAQAIDEAERSMDSAAAAIDRQIECFTKDMLPVACSDPRAAVRRDKNDTVKLGDDMEESTEDSRCS